MELTRSAKQFGKTLIEGFVCTAAVLLCGCATLPEADFAPAEEHVKVVTYNVNVGGDAARVVEFLRAADADIVCLQETHAKWERYLRKQLGGRYPHMIFHNTLGAGGISMLSKWPLDEGQVIRSSAGWFAALCARAATPLGDIRVLNVHLKPPVSDRGSVTPSALYNAGAIHLEEMETFLAAVHGKPAVIAGDFNEDESGKACRRLAELGYINALPLYDRKSPTWRWPTGWGLTLKERYDHVFVDPALECTGAAVFKVRASDHEPVMAALQMNNDE